MEDVYGELDNYEEFSNIDQLKEENLKQKQQIQEMTKAMEKLRQLILQDYDLLTASHKALEVNYSSLLKTARAEVERKTLMIANLNAEKDQLMFRRLSNSNMPNRTQFQRNNYNKNPSQSQTTNSGSVSPSETENKAPFKSSSLDRSQRSTTKNETETKPTENQTDNSSFQNSEYKRSLLLKKQDIKNDLNTLKLPNNNISNEFGRTVVKIKITQNNQNENTYSIDKTPDPADVSKVINTAELATKQSSNVINTAELATKQISKEIVTDFKQDSQIVHESELYSRDNKQYTRMRSKSRSGRVRSPEKDLAKKSSIRQRSKSVSCRTTTAEDEFSIDCIKEESRISESRSSRQRNKSKAILTVEEYKSSEFPKVDKDSRLEIRDVSTGNIHHQTHGSRDPRKRDRSLHKTANSINESNEQDKPVILSFSKTSCIDRSRPRLMSEKEIKSRSGSATSPDHQEERRNLKTDCQHGASEASKDKRSSSNYARTRDKSNHKDSVDTVAETNHDIKSNSIKNKIGQDFSRVRNGSEERVKSRSGSAKSLDKFDSPNIEPDRISENKSTSDYISYKRRDSSNDSRKRDKSRHRKLDSEEATSLCTSANSFVRKSRRDHCQSRRLSEEKIKSRSGSAKSIDKLKVDQKSDSLRDRKFDALTIKERTDHDPMKRDKSKHRDKVKDEHQNTKSKKGADDQEISDAFDKSLRSSDSKIRNPVEDPTKNKAETVKSIDKTETNPKHKNITKGTDTRLPEKCDQIAQIVDDDTDDAQLLSVNNKEETRNTKDKSQLQNVTSFLKDNIPDKLGPKSCFENAIGKREESIKPSCSKTIDKIEIQQKKSHDYSTHQKSRSRSKSLDRMLKIEQQLIEQIKLLKEEDRLKRTLKNELTHKDKETKQSRIGKFKSRQNSVSETAATFDQNSEKIVNKKQNEPYVSNKNYRIPKKKQSDKAVEENNQSDNLSKRGKSRPRLYDDFDDRKTNEYKKIRSKTPESRDLRYALNEIYSHKIQRRVYPPSHKKVRKEKSLSPEKAVDRTTVRKKFDFDIDKDYRKEKNIKIYDKKDRSPNQRDDRRHRSRSPTSHHRRLVSPPLIDSKSKNSRPYKTDYESRNHARYLGKHKMSYCDEVISSKRRKFEEYPHHTAEVYREYKQFNNKRDGKQRSKSFGSSHDYNWSFQSPVNEHTDNRHIVLPIRFSPELEDGGPTPQDPRLFSDKYKQINEFEKVTMCSQVGRNVKLKFVRYEEVVSESLDNNLCNEDLSKKKNLERNNFHVDVDMNTLKNSIYDDKIYSSNGKQNVPDDETDFDVHAIYANIENYSDRMTVNSGEIVEPNQGVDRVDGPNSTILNSKVGEPNFSVITPVSISSLPDGLFKGIIGSYSQNSSDYVSDVNKPYRIPEIKNIDCLHDLVLETPKSLEAVKGNNKIKQTSKELTTETVYDKVIDKSEIHDGINDELSKAKDENENRNENQPKLPKNLVTMLPNMTENVENTHATNNITHATNDNIIVNTTVGKQFLQKDLILKDKISSVIANVAISIEKNISNEVLNEKEPSFESQPLVSDNIGISNLARDLALSDDACDNVDVIEKRKSTETKTTINKNMTQNVVKIRSLKRFRKVSVNRLTGDTVDSKKDQTATIKVSGKSNVDQAGFVRSGESDDLQSKMTDLFGETSLITAEDLSLPSATPVKTLTELPCLRSPIAVNIEPYKIHNKIAETKLKQNSKSDLDTKNGSKKRDKDEKSNKRTRKKSSDKNKLNLSKKSKTKIESVKTNTDTLSVLNKKDSQDRLKNTDITVEENLKEMFSTPVKNKTNEKVSSGMDKLIQNHVEKPSKNINMTIEENIPEINILLKCDTQNQDNSDPIVVSQKTDATLEQNLKEIFLSSPAKDTESKNLSKAQKTDQNMDTTLEQNLKEIFRNSPNKVINLGSEKIHLSKTSQNNSFMSTSTPYRGNDSFEELSHSPILPNVVVTDYEMSERDPNVITIKTGIANNAPIVQETVRNDENCSFSFAKNLDTQTLVFTNNVQIVTAISPAVTSYSLTVTENIPPVKENSVRVIENNPTETENCLNFPKSNSIHHPNGSNIDSIRFSSMNASNTNETLNVPINSSATVMCNPKLTSVVDNSSAVTTNSSIGIGNNFAVTTNSFTAIDNPSAVTTNSSNGISNNVPVTTNSSTVIGNNSAVNTNNLIGIGNNFVVTSNSSTAIDNPAAVTTNSSNGISNTVPVTTNIVISNSLVKTNNSCTGIGHDLEQKIATPNPPTMKIIIGRRRVFKSKK